MAKRKHLINVHTSTGTTAPTGASLYLGEIAVQHKATDPALWIKVGAAESSTQYEKFVGEKAVTSAISQAVSSAVTITGVTQNGTSVVSNKVAAIVETSVSTANGTTSNTPAAVVTGITAGGTKGHALTLAKTNKVFSATTSDSALTVLSAVTSLSAQTAILGPNYTYSGISYVNSATSVADAYSALTNEMINDEKVISAAFNDLNTRVNEISAATHGQGGIESITLNGDEYTGTSVNLGTVVRTETQLSTASTGTGNVVTDLTVSNHQITKNFGMTIPSWATASTKPSYTLDEVSDGTTRKLSDYASSANVTSLSASVVSNKTAVGKIAVTGVTVTGTGNAVTNATYSNSALTLTKGNVQATISDLSTIRSNAQSGASAYTRVNDLSAVTLTGVSVIGTALPVSNHTVNVPSASSTAFGVVKAGTFLTSTNGTLSVNTGTTNTTVAVGNHTHSTFTNNVDFNGGISTENGNSYPSGFGWIEDFGGRDLQSVLDGISAETSHALTMQLNGTQVGQYSPSANTTINMKVDGTNVMLTSAYTMNTGTSRAALEVTSADSTTEAFGKVSKVIYLDELITSSALNDLNDRVYELEQGGGAASEDLLELSGVVIDFETDVAQDIAEINERIDNLGGGELSSAYTMATGSTEQQISLHSGDTFEVAFGKMEKREYDNELAFAAALNVLNNNIQGIQGLPAVTSADNGKILAVVNGQWALVSPNDLLGNN